MLVEGEIVDPVLSGNGHLYFRLRDRGGELKAVMWRSDVARMRSHPKPGDQVTARGKLSLYAPRGEVQFSVSALMRSGKGAKLAELRELTLRLRGEGLLDRPKRPLPARVKRLGLVTSVSSAVLHDIYQTVRRRDPSVELWLSPASVSGPSAAAELTVALERLRGLVQAVIVARGGGSFEELLPFSDEQLARSAASFPVPVISAVGHGSDVTILDLVADQHVPTPTAAAELCTVPREDRLLSHQRMRERLLAAIERHSKVRRNEWASLSALCRAQHPLGRLRRQGELVGELQARAERALYSQLNEQRYRLKNLEQRCRSQHPKGRLQRGRESLGSLQDRLLEGIKRRLAEERRELEGLRKSCLNLGPSSVLERGFALVTQEGVPVTSSRGRRPGEELELHLADGRLRVTILQVDGPPL